MRRVVAFELTEAIEAGDQRIKPWWNALVFALHRCGDYVLPRNDDGLVDLLTLYNPDDEDSDEIERKAESLERAWERLKR